MELNNYLYREIFSNEDGPHLSGSIELLPSCDIYSGHFKGLPITPGACLVKIAEELIREKVHLSIESVRDARFLAIVNPEESNVLTYKFMVIKSEGSPCRVDFSFYIEDVVCAKLSFMMVEQC